MYYSQPGIPSSPQQTVNVMKVTGEGSVSANPDQAKISLGVITENLSLSNAQKENTEQMTRVIRSLLAMGIRKEDIQTVNFRIEPQYNYENGKQTFRGYQVNHQILVTVRQLNQIGQIIDAAVSNGANSVSSIQFTVASPDAFYNKALSLALQNAQVKALTMARDLRVTVNPVPFRVQELSKAVPPRPIPFETTMMAHDSAVPIQAGEIRITASVEAEFTYG